MPKRCEINCPLCGEEISLPMSVIPKITHTYSYEGFVTVEILVGGCTHRCPRLIEGDPIENRRLGI